MIKPINSPEHAAHAAGFVAAIADRAAAYRPDPAPIMRRTLPYCDCDKRICPVCYPPSLQRRDWLTRDDIVALSGRPVNLGEWPFLPADDLELVDTGTFAEICERYPAGKLQDGTGMMTVGYGVDADGWIEWSGGECPVANGVLVDVKLRSGSIYYAQKAMAASMASPQGWRIGFYGDPTPCSLDIIAYRLHRPETDHNQPDIMFIDDGDESEGGACD